MAQAFISTGQPNLRATFTTSVAASYSQRVVTQTRPTAGILLDMAQTQGYSQPSLIRVFPCGVRSDGAVWTTSGTTTSFRLYGWQSYYQPDIDETYWVPSLLTQHTLLFPTSAPITNVGPLGSEMYFFSGTGAVIADATLTRPTPNIYSPNGTATSSSSNQTPASVLVDLAGAQLVTIDFIAPAPGGGLTITMGALWYAI